MTGETRAAVNRRNAARSTGPRSERGRAAAARNALRHGMTAEQLVLFDERAEDFLQFRDELLDVLAPADAVEEVLAERVAVCAWRLRRASRIEADFLNGVSAASGWEEPPVSAPFRVRAQETALLSRYEGTIERSFHRAQMMLERRQARRRGEAVAPPIAVQLEIGGAADAIAKIDETNPGIAL